MEAIWLDDDLEKLKKEVSECIEKIINYEMSSSLGKFIKSTLTSFIILNCIIFVKIQITIT